MARSFKNEPPSLETIPKDLPGIERKEYTIKIVTPMFGGGVKPGENDAAMLIRPTTIRGHLRFWWRVLHGAQYHTVAEMRDAENAIWGSTDIPSGVSVRVEMLKKGAQKACATFPPNGNFPRFEPHYPGYALFPFQGKKRGGVVTEQPKEATSGIEFKLTCNCQSDIAQEVESAIWAWVNFGGIGARTRRGCGALQAEKLPIQNIENNMFYRVLLGPICNSAMSAWEGSVSIYRSFRQQRNPGDGPRPGRSRWTEPDVLRSHANRQNIDPNHLTPINNVATESFPRILLGAPIIFHSHQESGLNTNVDVVHTTLGQTDRMASPIITRPVFYAGGWRAGLLVLRSPDAILESIGGVYVHSEDRQYPPSAVRNESLKNIKAFEKSNNRADNAIDALIDFAQANGFKKISEVSR